MLCQDAFLVLCQDAAPALCQDVVLVLCQDAKLACTHCKEQMLPSILLPSIHRKESAQPERIRLPRRILDTALRKIVINLTGERND